MRLQPALQLVGEPADRAFQRVELLVEIGAQPFQLGRFGQVLGGDFLVVIGHEHPVIRVGLGDRRRRRRFQRRLALGHLGIFAHLLVGQVIHADLGLGLVLLIVLGAFRVGVGVLILAVILTCGIGLFLVVGILLGLVVLVFVLAVGVVAQLVAIAQVADHLAGQLGKGGLVVQQRFDVFQRAAGLFLDKRAPQVHHVLRAFGQRASGGQVAHQIARRRGQWRIGGLADLVIAATGGVMADLGVDIAGGAGHVAGAHRLAAGGFHRLVQVARHVARRRIAGMGRLVMVFAMHRQRVGGAARQQHLVAGHAAADLGQAHRLAGQARRIDGIADRQFGVIGHHLGGLGQRLFERVGRVVGFLRHARAFWSSRVESAD